MIAIIDYGMGNLRSVQKGFEYVGLEAEVTNNPERIKNASHVVLPGVGAFIDAMECLRTTGFIDIIYKSVSDGKPFLGICLGMQLLLEKSCEGGAFDGLGIIKGEVKRLPIKKGLKVPHMGWNELKQTDDPDNPLFKGIKNNSFFYFVHSYYVDTPEKDCVIGTVDYGMDISVALKKGLVFGLQFHPEKSGSNGLRILENFGGLR